MSFVPFMTKEICKFFICLVNVLIVRILFFDLNLTCDEHGVDFTCNLFAPRFVLSGASNVVNVDVRTELFGCFWVLGFRGSGEGLHCSSCYIGCRLVSKVKPYPLIVSGLFTVVCSPQKLVEYLIIRVDHYLIEHLAHVASIRNFVKAPRHKHVRQTVNIVRSFLEMII